MIHQVNVKLKWTPLGPIRSDVRNSKIVHVALNFAIYFFKQFHHFHSQFIQIRFQLQNKLCFVQCVLYRKKPLSGDQFTP